MSTVWMSLTVDGKLTEYETKATLSDMQKAVGGYIEPVDVDDFTVMVNEEGLLIDLPLNLIASALSGRQLVGDVCIVGQPDAYGNTKKLSKRAVSFVHMAVDTVRGLIPVYAEGL
jgi:hypothetical protein